MTDARRRGSHRARARRAAVAGRALLVAGIGAGSAAALVALASRVAGRGGLPVDLRVRRRLQRLRSPALDAAARVLTLPGYPVVYVPASLWLAARLRRGGARGGAVVVSALAGWASHHAVKLLVERRRPPSQRGRANYLEAFPSGHTTPVTAIALAAGWVAAREGLAPARRVLPVALGVPAAVGTTRAYLDRHWLTDVIGGWVEGAMVAALAAGFHEAARPAGARPRRPRVRPSSRPTWW